MKIPKWLEEKRNHASELEFLRQDNSIGYCPEDYKDGFNACAELLLPEIELLKQDLEDIENTRLGGLDFTSEANFNKMVVQITYPIVIKALARINERFPREEDPTPWCSACGAKRKSQCNCGPIADNE